MGREYFGDIEGKFWFAVQSSYDADHFLGSYTHPYRFYGCGCTVETKEKYCKDCFSSFEEHCQETENRDLIYQDKNLCEYQFTKENLANVKKVLKQLENEYGNLIISYDIQDFQGSIRYIVEYLPSFRYVNLVYEDEDKMKKLENIARICLGRQIVYCLEKKGSCYFTAEV